MTLADRVQKRMTELDITQEQLAEMADTSQTTISNILNGTTKKPRNLLELSKSLGVSAEWLQTGVGETNLVSLTTEEKNDDEDAIVFEVLDIKASAGFGSSGDVMEVIHQIKFNSTHYFELFRGMNPDNISIISVKGDSMSPTFENGDLLFVDTSINTYDGDGIYVFTFDNFIFVKRIQKTGKYFSIISDNKFYEPWELDGECVIHGKVKVHQSQRLNFIG